jgi:DNA-binding GntR family transcriptional regulator
MVQSSRIPILARKIAAYIRSAQLEPGTRLTERGLAEQFEMSRTPIKQALRLLANGDVVAVQEAGGFVVGVGTGTGLSEDPDQAGDDAPYLRMARDHLAGLLPDRVSENVLMRRYDAKRTEIVGVLHRAAREGWVERLPGHGWKFLPVLTSVEAYAQAYRFRLLVEPAGIIEPGFVMDRQALLSCRAQQVMLLGAAPGDLSRAAMFNIATSFHDVVIRCSRNTFFIQALTRLTQLRRLIEYDKVVDRTGWLGRCAQHLEIIDLLLAQDRPAAEALMRRHLELGAGSKVQS